MMTEQAISEEDHRLDAAPTIEAHTLQTQIAPVPRRSRCLTSHQGAGRARRRRNDFKEPDTESGIPEGSCVVVFPLLSR